MSQLRQVCILVLAAVATAPVNAQSTSAPAPAGATVSKASVSFPACNAVIDITKPPYSAKGDGKTDDTAAIQKALADTMGKHKIIYFPNGTYLVSSTIRWSKKDSAGGEAWGFNWLQGQSQSGAVIRLADGTFTDASKPASIMWCGGFGSADWFHNYIQNLTFDTGRGNPGAVGLQFYSNNSGALRDLSIVSQDGKGAIGLDLGFRDMNGPLLVSQVTIKGFAKGISTGGAVNSQTFEHISILDAGKVGLSNGGQCISVRGLRVEGAPQAVENRGLMAMVDSELIGSGPAAIANGKSRLLARNIHTRGFDAAITSQTEIAAPAGAEVKEYISHKGSSPFGAPVASLNLPVRETPTATWDAPATWAVVDAFGADPTGNRDSAEAIQKAIDSGAATVFFPGAYTVRSPVTVRGKVKRLLGSGNWIDYTAKSKPDLIIADGESPVVTVEHFNPINGGMEITTSRTVVLRSVQSRVTIKGKGDLFLEDFGSDDLRIDGNNVWARQLNVENQGTHVTNKGGTLWVLGYKTERGGTLVETIGGRSEVLGNFSYTTTAGKLAPMFVTTDAEVFAFFGEVCFGGDPFRTLVKETRQGQTRTVEAGKGSTAPYVSGRK